MAEAGGRLFVDVTRQLSSPATRADIVATFERHDPLMGAALRTIIDRGFIPVRPDEDAPAPPASPPPAPLETDPAIVTELVERGQTALATLKAEIATKTGTALVMFDPRSTQAIMAGMKATWWLNDQAREWLGEKDVADTLAQSVPGNVTSEMGLALLDVADAIRPHPDVVRYLQHVGADDGFLDKLPELDGGLDARDAIASFLDAFGMRCVGEIDITRRRWGERPAQLLPMILGNIKNFTHGAAKRRFEQGRRNAWDKERELLARLRTLPDGERRADEAKRMIDRLRTFTGYREYPKYHMISRYFVYKQAVLNDTTLPDKENIFYLRFPELRDVAATGEVDQELIHRRYDEFRSYRALTPPRVLTSDGEAVEGSYGRTDIPAGALAGLPVSAGTVEGRARVVLDLGEADFDEGDILVTAYTDPSWTPAFVAIAGLVTEVGA